MGHYRPLFLATRRISAQWPASTNAKPLPPPEGSQGGGLGMKKFGLQPRISTASFCLTHPLYIKCLSITWMDFPGYY